MEAEVAATEHGEFKLEYRVLASDGRVVWLRDEAMIIWDEEDRPRFWQGVIFDITERKRAEEEVRRLNETLEQRVAERTERLQAALRELGRRPLRPRRARSLRGLQRRSVPSTGIHTGRTAAALGCGRSDAPDLGRGAASEERRHALGAGYAGRAGQDRRL